MASRTAHRTVKILGSQVIAVDHLLANPKNPRPNYQFEEDNPDIRAISDSFALDGQHNPIKCYELLPERPGYFMLVQGHRRLFAARASGQDTLECTIIARPQSEAEELDWISSEDTLRSDWGLFSRMSHARRIALANGFETMTDPRLIAKTGLTALQLARAEKMFRLESAIIAHVKLWEEYRYRQNNAGEGVSIAADFTVDSGIRVTDFAPDKAAITWDIFVALKKNCASIREVSEWTDLHLQQRIAQMVSRGSLSEAEQLRIVIESISRNNLQPGVPSQISSLLVDSGTGRTMRDVVRTTKNGFVSRLLVTTERLTKLADPVAALAKNVDQLGSDPDVLRRSKSVVETMLWRLTDLQSKLERHIERLDRMEEIRGR